ncbi:MAG: metalloregulator ArsR/SmtB family transcription factor [Spirochaetaceae bacterium]|jgi:DNA-binding transcriptional ArsR family regulator|nr:metalloregulator ArsR/SmtB family transcription factor [Spirochaetaceae bacterium]
MNYQKEKTLAQSRAKVIKALGHPTRIFMVALLSEKERSVGELTEIAGADVSTISKHLSILTQQGILTFRKEGNRVLYNLICPCIMQFIHCIDDVIYKDAQRGLSCILPDLKIPENTQANNPSE